MKTTLNWKKGLFSTCYDIYSRGTVVGKLKEKTWTDSAYGELNGKKYNFITGGFLEKETQIIDNETNTTIGKIIYNSLKTKARIELGNKVVNWSYTNAVNTKWSLTSLDGKEIKYQGTSTSGRIEFDDENELLILIGLFITNHYWQSSVAVMIAIFIPIWVTIIN
jgi:hypothetical protein